MSPQRFIHHLPLALMGLREGFIGRNGREHSNRNVFYSGKCFRLAVVSCNEFTC
jgi:hypothetical protein